VVASRIAGLIAGSAPLATLVPLRAVTSVVVLDHGRVAAAVEYARKKGAHVITMSLGGPWSSSLRAAIDKAIADGVIVLAAAGNCVRIVVWPARYEEVIAVAGFNIADQPWIGTCRGDAVDISAPGEFVPRANRSPSNGGSPTDVRGGQGTSFAVALTAGVAALWVSYYGLAAIKAKLQPGETVQDRFIALLKATSWRPAGPWQDDEFGAGIVDAKALLAHGLEPPAGAVESVVAASDSLRSVYTALAEAAPGSLEGVTEATIGPPSSRRYAAELSHLALAKQKRRNAGGALEGLASDPPPSETLRNELQAAGRLDLLEALS
jgi:lambda repressor-like predicted transcriptional regulator